MSKLFGMIHLPSLKSHSQHSIDEIVDYAITQGKLLEKLQYDGAVLENFGDSPFAKTEVDDIVLAKLSIICHEVRKQVDFKLGLNILRNATKQAMTVASVTKFDFVRSNIWESAYVTDQGIIEGVAREVMQTKTHLQSEVEVYSDIFVKHATPLSDFSIVEAATQALDRGGADHVIISGRHTGDEIEMESLQKLNDMGIRPIIGSGLTHNTIKSISGEISGAIVGTAIKEDTVTSPIDRDKAKLIIDTWKEKFS